MKRRLTIKSAVTTALVILGVIVAVLVAGSIASFLSSRDRLPGTTTIGDVDVTGLTINEAVTRTNRLLLSPVALRYQSSIIQMDPASIDFQVNNVVLNFQLDKLLAAQKGFDKLPDYILRRTKETRLEIPYQYSEEKLSGYLDGMAKDNDRATKAPQPDASGLQLSPGQDGVLLNRSEAQRLLLNALTSSSARFVDLPVDVIPYGGATIQSLGDLIKARLAKFNGGIAGVYVKDLKTGQSFAVNGDIAFSGQGWLKLTIALESIRSTGQSGASQTVVSAVTDGTNAKANEVLAAIGQGDAQVGVNQLNQTLKRMGLVNTFLAQPYDQSSTPPTVFTPANTRIDINASPDPLAQTTPAEISLFLEMLEQCHNGTGGLPLAFGKDLNAAKCDQILGAIGKNNARILISAASPGAVVFRRQSWDANNHGDAALVRSPGGVYVLAVMLHGNTALNWGETSLLISDIARAAYGYFNSGQTPAAVPALNAAPPR